MKKGFVSLLTVIMVSFFNHVLSQSKVYFPYFE